MCNYFSSNYSKVLNGNFLTDITETTEGYANTTYEDESRSDFLFAIKRYSSHSVVNSIPNFFRYNYDSSERPEYSINDGGSDMYDVGNKVREFLLV